MTSAARPLAALLEGLVPAATIDAIGGKISIEDIGLDSRTLGRGALFLACRGRRTHGLRSAGEAIARGARAIAYEPTADIDTALIAQLRASATVELIAVPELSAQASRIADRFFAAPSRQLQIAGITGTNGKTTTAWLVASALQAARSRCAYMGTLGVGEPPDRVMAGEYTTADAVSVQRQLAAVRAGGAQCVAMEVSSHALDQHRVDAVNFRVAAFTNLTRDHLDYHGTMAAYGAAKARLFAMPELASCVINVDDAFGLQLAERQVARMPTWLVARDAGMVDAQRLAGRHANVHVLHAETVQATARGQRIRLRDGAQSIVFEVPLLGDFNVENVLVAIGVLEALGFERARAAVALADVAAPPGRMELISVPGRPLAIVDYAHTPDALGKALRAARGHCRGRLRVVFGCGGERDRGKRPEMGRIAAELADDLIITDDNPRGESPAAIAAEIVAGLPAGHAAQVVHDRATAIRVALERAAADDIVLIAGKGHESYQLVGDERRDFSDRGVARAALAAGAAGATP